MDRESQLKARLDKLLQIGVALSSERNLPRLLDMIVGEARDLTSSDGGTLYLVEGDPPESIKYFVMQNGSMGTRMGGDTGKPIPFPNIPLYMNGAPNDSNISAYCARTGQTINIPDWRTYPGFDFTGPKKFEEATGYVSKSHLVVAMRDHEDQIIGVLLLINRMDPETREKIAFSDDDVKIIEALGSQAAVAITNVRLIEGLEKLFESFAEVMASAIDERSPATSGHIRRVTQVTMALAEAANKETEGPAAEIKFTPEELKELRLAALLHDVGKVTTPIHIVEKANKLEAVYDRGREVNIRFEYVKKQVEADFLKQKLALIQTGAPPEALAALDEELNAKLQEVSDDQAFIMQANVPVEFMPPEKVERIKAIGAKTYMLNGEEKPLLTDDELKNLIVQKGNITGDELQIMRDHASVSIKLLSQIPWTRKLRNIPKIAGAHHEVLNGKGYPYGLKGEEITLQTRIMTIADIYDAVTASDRSYKKAMPQEIAVKILEKAMGFGELDPRLMEVFIRHELYRLIGKSQADLEAEAAARAAAQQAKAEEQTGAVAAVAAGAENKPK